MKKFPQPLNVKVDVGKIRIYGIHESKFSDLHFFPQKKLFQEGAEKNDE